MAKRITLPLGMVIGNVSAIGTPVLVSGKTYDFSDITITQIRNTIGGSTYDVKDLCLHAGINKWAAFKPYREGLAGQFHHGMEIAVDNIIKYLKPNDTYGYKMGHFAGYNHTAPVPGRWGNPTGLFYSSTGVQTLTLLIELPEWDLRDLASTILGAIADISGVKSYTAFTNAIMEVKTIPLEVSVNCSSASKTEFTVALSLGNNNGGTITKVCEFPHASETALSLNAIAYNISVPALSSMWNNFSPGSVMLSWGTRESAIIDYYKLEKSLNNSTWTQIYTGSDHSYNDTDVLPNTTYYYRLKFKSTVGGENTGSTNTITTGDLDGT